MKSLITLNATNPSRALIGIVRIQTQTMFRAIPHRTALSLFVAPTPMIDEQMTWVVLTGIPATEAPRIVAAPAV